jgi:hypothetical protein
MTLKGEKRDQKGDRIKGVVLGIVAAQYSHVRSGRDSVKRRERLREVACFLPPVCSPLVHFCYSRDQCCGQSRMINM